MKELKLPDPVCGSICKLSMSEKCIECCAPKKTMELLEVREELTIDEMPKFRRREDLPWEARFRLYEAYLEKVVDQDQGVSQRGSVGVDTSKRDIFVDSSNT